MELNACKVIVDSLQDPSTIVAVRTLMRKSLEVYRKQETLVEQQADWKTPLATLKKTMVQTSEGGKGKNSMKGKMMSKRTKIWRKGKMTIKRTTQKLTRMTMVKTWTHHAWIETWLWSYFY